MDCVFCKIISRETPSEIVYEDEKVLVIKDIKPITPIHFLIIPKEHLASVNYLEEKDKALIGQLFLVAKKIAQDSGISKEGYRLILNTGKDAGQSIDHLHLHILGGKTLTWP